MSATNVPLGDMKTDAQSAIYIAALEKKLMILTLNEMKYRTLLEMLTGKEWEELSTDIGADKLRQVAVNATQRRLARSLRQADRQAQEAIRQKAEQVVAENIATANEFAQPSEST